MSQTFKTASDYTQKGFSVIPLKSKSKEALRSWKEFQSRRATLAQIESWWKDIPNANVGIVTGKVSGIVVIDCDSKEASKRFVKAYPEAHLTLQTKTGKGKHYYFKWVTGVRNSAATKLGRGVDIRGEGGYVVAPPSIHPNGVKYKWLNKKPIQALPNQLRELLISTGKAKLKPKTNSLDRIIREGQRNSTLTSLAGSMHSRGVDHDTMLNGLLIENRERCAPPLSKDEVKKIVDSVARYPVLEKPRDLTEAGNARRFATQHGSDLRYCHRWNKWLVWDGTRWQNDDNDEAMRMAKNTAKSIYSEAVSYADGDVRKDIARHAVKSESAYSLQATLQLAKSEPGITARPEDFDKDPWLLNVMNGVINLKTGQLEPAIKERLLTKLAPVEFSSKAKCPEWEKFLCRIMNRDRDMISFLQRAIGYSLTGSVREQKLFFFYGTGPTGNRLS